MDEEKRRVIRALAPLLIHPPPIIQNPQLLYPSVDITDMPGFASAAVAGAMTVTIADCSKESTPRPQQGGCRITTQYLLGLPDTEARWAFRYVC